MDDLELAIYKTAHDHKGGVPALAKRLGCNAGTLQNKVDPGMPGHRLNIFEARAIMMTTGDHRILKALAADLGYIPIDAADRSTTSDVDLLTAYARLDKERGDVGARMRDALEDSRITREEVRKIRQEAREEIEALHELLARMEAIAED